MKKQKFKVTSLIVLTIFCIFAICTMTVLLTGAQVYESLADRSQEQFEQRTVARYITTRVRQSDVANELKVAEFGGQSALVFRELIEGNYYDTYVYCYNGYVRELFVSAEGSFGPEDGEKVLKVESLDFALDGTILKASVVLRNHTRQELVIHLRSAAEGDEL